MPLGSATPKTVAGLRDQADRDRRLARHIAAPNADRSMLCRLAKELEAKAVELERRLNKGLR